MLRYGFFDSEIVGYDEEEMPIFDRAESSDFLAMFISKIISDGVLAAPADCFQVVAYEGTTLKVKPGFGIIRGRFAYDNKDAEIEIPKAPKSLKRIDRVVIRVNYVKRLCEIIVKEGTPSTNPSPPELIRPKSGDYYEMCLATVSLNANQTLIMQSNIRDTRYDSSVCGIVTQVIDHIDTAVFFTQFNAFYEEFVKKSDTAYAKFLKDFNDRYDLFNQMAQSAYDAYANDIDVYIEQIKSMALEKYSDTSERMNAFYRQITQEGQDLSDEYHRTMDELSETFEKDAAKQYDKTIELLSGLSNRAMDIYSQFSADIISFYNDISEKGNQRYEEFDSEITTYIEELRRKGDTRLANITQELLTWAIDHQNEFIEWFDNIKNTLSTDQAGKLQAEIEDQSKMIDLILEMLYSGVIMAPITTEEDFQIVDEEGTPIMMDEPICKCAEKAEETETDTEMSE